MTSNNFKIDYSIPILTRFNTPVKWWQFKKVHTLDLPISNQDDFTSELNLTNLVGEIEVKSTKASFLESSRGRTFFNAYLAALRVLNEQQRAHLKEHFNYLFGYSLDLIIENKQSHTNPVTLDAFDLQGAKQLQHTARALKSAQMSGKKLILNNDSTDGFTEEYVYIADYWHIDKDTIELRYQDWDEESADIDKVHTSFLDAKLFTQQFGRAANDISDYLQKIANALQISLNDLEN